MNKREKEIFQQDLDNEEKVLSDLTKMYQRALRDIGMKIRMLQSDELTQSRIYQIQYQKALQGQIEGILEKLHGDEYSTIQKYLSDEYTNAFIGNMYALHGQGVPVIIPIDRKAAVKAVVTDSKLSVPLYASLGHDMDKLKKHIREEITRGIASSLPYEQIAQNLAGFTDIPLNRAKTIVRTEGHRIQQSSTDDARRKAKAKGADVVKQWDASLDGATRPTHRKLDGQIREIDEPFEANGKKAMYPGKFNDPGEDCNCRCVALTRARSALDEKELATLKERAEFFGLDKTEDFEDFKKKYLTGSADQNKPVKTFDSDAEKFKGYKKIKGDHDFIDDLKATNPKGYTENCQQCCCTYEARRRGFDVIAQDTQGQRYLFEEAFEGGKSGLVHLWKGITEMKVSIKEIRGRLEKQMQEFGDGARVFVTTFWEYSNAAHVFVAENHNGKIVYFDPQSGDKDFSDAWDRMHRNTSFIRVDDKPFTDKVREAVRKK